MLYFTSDLHFGHANILTLAGRKWRTVEEMDAALIKNINKTVGPHDELWVLGDFGYRSTLEEQRECLHRITCKNRHLILGNHDKDWKSWAAPDDWASINDYQEIKTERGVRLCLFHYPLIEWNGSRRGKQSFNLHGHIHSKDSDFNIQNFRKKTYRYDVGVDANNFCPVSIDEILALTQP